ncbi:MULTISPECIES: hypothetical protein [Priestia]|uniref:hypothetical protein n=1 Tax=Priestia TaxID=2800373 RepID=UPI002877867A|nr:hypothetical protein [Priestia megaterium]MBX4162809.1 hypothetical protein [Priestia megaterium]
MNIHIKYSERVLFLPTLTLPALLSIESKVFFILKLPASSIHSQSGKNGIALLFA